MATSAISKIIWEKVKTGDRKFGEIKPETMKEQVLSRAKEDVEIEKITEETFKRLTGQKYVKE